MGRESSQHLGHRTRETKRNSPRGARQRLYLLPRMPRGEWMLVPVWHILQKLEDVLQPELNQARVDRRAGDITEGSTGHTQIAGVAELCVIEGIEHFCTEDQCCVFMNASNLGRFDQR